LPFQYQLTPFNTPEQVQMGPLGCHGFVGGAKDLSFNDMEFGEQVYAVESGTVVFIRNNATCFSRPTPDPNDDPNIWELFDYSTNTVRLTFNITDLDDIRRASSMIPPDCPANEIVVRGSDNFFTNYVHVYPSNNLTVGSTVQIGDFLGNIDNSSLVTGPHIHFVRYRPNPNFDQDNPDVSPFWSNGGTCNWTMFNVTGIDLIPKNGWVKDEDSGIWYVYINGIRQKNRFVSTNNITWYWVNNNGFYTGSYYYYDNTKKYYRLWWTPTQRWYRWNGSAWVLEENM